jgi:hypothetical protein
MNFAHFCKQIQQVEVAMNPHMLLQLLIYLFRLPALLRMKSSGAISPSLAQLQQLACEPRGQLWTTIVAREPMIFEDVLEVLTLGQKWVIFAPLSEFGPNVSLRLW